MEEVFHERELREQWQSDHMHVHELEREALDKAETAVNSRLEGMNELRAQINTERGTYATRDYVDTVNSSTDGRLRRLENSRSYAIGWVAAVGIAFSVVMYFLGKR